jgi:hypothetical protein
VIGSPEQPPAIAGRGNIDVAINPVWAESVTDVNYVYRLAISPIGERDVRRTQI